MEGKPLFPSYASNLVNQQATNVASQFNTVLNDVIAILLPVSYDQMSTNKLSIRAAANDHQGTPTPGLVGI